MQKTIATSAARRPELMAPAGGPDAGYAAFQFGADAIYLGLQQFSARADAENFSPAEFSAITDYAHALTPPRRVYVALNTLIQEAESPAALEAMALASETGADALIIQDLGVLRLARAYFPQLRLHASTQLAIHDTAGARMARRLGFSRVTLARELTMQETGRIAADSGIDIEIFAHGALCHGYSGLCLFSSMLPGRSGNRGQCAYLCRNAFTTIGELAVSRNRQPDGGAAPARGDFIFSMKDLALLEHLPQLRRLGVSALKIEGRKKSPLYVAMVTRLYRRMLDGPADAGELRALADDVQTVFSRPWTELYARSAANADVVDRNTTGHRGCLIGQTAAIKPGRDGHWLCLRTTRALELHDGLQIDLPGAPRPFGFAVTNLRSGASHTGKKMTRVDAGAHVNVLLPRGHPQIPIGSAVYCSSSQAVKRAGRLRRPRPGQYRVRRAVCVALSVHANGLRVRAPSSATDEIEFEIPCDCAPARSGALTLEAARAVFAQLGDTGWQLSKFTLANTEQRFAPVSALKNARRQMTAQLDAQAEKTRAEFLARAVRELTTPVSAHDSGARCAQQSNDAPSVSGLKWSLKTDQPGCLSNFNDTDHAGLDELTLDIAKPDLSVIKTELDKWSDRLGHNRLRLALPIITRATEHDTLIAKTRALLNDGWRRWEISNLNGWNLLARAGGAPGDLDLAADWPLYVVNSSAAQSLRAAGVSKITLSPEDGRDNWRILLPRLPLPAMAVVYQDTPLMISETCAARPDNCERNPKKCPQPELELVSTHGDRLRLCRRGCRNVLIKETPLNLTNFLAELAALGVRHVRADFIWRAYTPHDTTRIWRALRSGATTPGHPGNFERGFSALNHGNRPKKQEKLDGSCEV